MYVIYGCSKANISRSSVIGFVKFNSSPANEVPPLNIILATPKFKTNVMSAMKKGIKNDTVKREETIFFRSALVSKTL